MEQLLDGLKSDEPNYSDIGATLAGERPDGFHHDHCQVELGHGPGVF